MSTVESKKQLKEKFHFIQLIRNYFVQHGFIDVMTPHIVQCPGIEPHLHPFSVHGKNLESQFLQTSPEFHMKELLSLGFENIFTLCSSFRDEPKSTTHRPEFIMLEWYRSNQRYEKIMKDSEDLINHLINEMDKRISVQSNLKNSSFHFFSIQEIFNEILNFNLFDFYEHKDLLQKIQLDFKDIPASSDQLDWDDLFFLLFLNKIEPELKNYPKLILTEYPASQAALSTIKKNDSRVCERFEIYLNGVEIGNCFNELLDIDIQKKRFLQSKGQRQKLYQQEMPEPKVLFSALKRGFPPSAGIAVGVERLFGTICNIDNPFWPQ